MADDPATAPWWVDDILLGEPAPRPRGSARASACEWDVIVVGAGCAGLAAAIFAHDAGRSVVILEAAEEGGGTTWKSGGGLWVPNNHVMRALGLSDDREGVLRFISRMGYGDVFDPDAERYGLGAWEWGQLNAFYDNAADALEELERSGALVVRELRSFTEQYPAMVPYHADVDDTLAAYYRHVAPKTKTGSGPGHELIRQLWAAAENRGIELLTQHRVRELVVDGAGAVSGVVAENTSGDAVPLAARRGVIFATGGFAHDEQLLEEHFRAPLYSSCAVPSARGDFVRLARDAGADLAHMGNAWYHQDVLEKVAAGGRECMEGGINVPTGDSMIIVDRWGERVVNEKAMYQERGGVHFEPGADGSFPNRVLFMVYDEFVATDHRMWLCLDTFVAPKPWIIEAPGLPQLAAAIEDRLAQYDELTNGMRLDSGFADRLAETIERFNGFARVGRDEDFGRGRRVTERDWTGPARPGNEWNPTMHPLSSTGPYYCVMLCGHILDTNGGPRIDPHGRVLRHDESVIDGLYGAGNCVASIAGKAYLSGGSTLGPAIAFAYAAARHAVQREPAGHPVTAAK